MHRSFINDAIGFAPFGLEGQPVDGPIARSLTLGGYVAPVIYSNASPDDRAYGLIIHPAPDEFLIAGDGMAVRFSSAAQRQVGLAEAWEQFFTDGKWVNGRRLNGDQTNQGSAVQIPFWRWDNCDSVPGPRVVKVKRFSHD